VEKEKERASREGPGSSAQNREVFATADTRLRARLVQLRLPHHPMAMDLELDGAGAILSIQKDC